MRQAGAALIAALIGCTVASVTCPANARAAIERPASLDASQGQYAVIAPIFADAAGNVSYIRLLNQGGTLSGPPPTYSTTTYSITIVGSPSGTVYGTTSIRTPAYATLQYSIFDILNLAGIAGLSGGDTGYALFVQDADPGTGFMHVIYNNASGFFENASTCQNFPDVATEDPSSSTPQYLFGVDTSVLSAYPSQIYIHNYDSVTVTFQVTVRDALTGNLIGSVNIQPNQNSTTVLPFTYFEQQLGWVPAANQDLANLTFVATGGPTTTPALVSDFVVNQKLNTYVNLSAYCGVNNVAPGSYAGSGTGS